MNYLKHSAPSKAGATRNTEAIFKRRRGGMQRNEEEETAAAAREREREKESGGLELDKGHLRSH